VRLEQLTPDHVRAAVAIYLRHAFPPGSQARPRTDPAQLEGLGDLAAVLARFDREADSDGERLKCYALRLGNHRYPFMKLVVQEYLVKGEYFFCVDTHDNLDVRPSSPDYVAWEDLKSWNRRLKRAIEDDWAAAGLPTHDDLRQLIEELASLERPPAAGSARRRVLLVDDERAVALGLKALLEARGYEVELSHDGHAALARLGTPPRPDLVLLDYELPGLDGEEVLRRARLDPRLADVPILMATAASIDLARLQRVSGLLRKPYPRQVLMAMIERLIGAGRPNA
jgi:CheY-like chemotaxis protein